MKQDTNPFPVSEQPQKELIYHEEFKTQGPVNLNAITVHGNNDIFVIEPGQQTYIQTRLVIDKKTGRPRETNWNEQFENPFDFKKNYSVFLGVITVLEKPFLVLADEVQQVCVLDNNGIFTLSSLSFVPFDNDQDFFNSDKGTAAVGLIINLRRLLTQGFYFSFTYDLTLSKSKRAQNCSFDTKFMWNYHMCKDLIAFDVSAQWFIPLIQGHVGHFKTTVNKKPLKCWVISRRAWLRSGTRNNVKGLDDQGNVANFVETEQIVYYENHYCSHVQIRGNPPVFFQQAPATISTQIKTTRNAAFTNRAFLEHMKILAGDWSYLLCLNLLSSTKKEEQALTDIFEYLIRKNPFNRIKYEFFDYLAVVKSGKLDKINILIQKLRPMLENMTFFVENEIAQAVLLNQKGVIRTSCIDALDRSNAIQMKIGAAIMDVFLKRLGVNLQTELTQDPVLQLDIDDSKQNHPLMIAFKDIWNKNGDSISIHYTGAISTGTGVKNTKSSLMSFLEEGMKSINVFQVSPLEDYQRQEGIDLILNQHSASGTALEKSIKEALKTRQAEFCRIEEVSVYCVTWNVANFTPTLDFNLTELFTLEGHQIFPDIVAIGLQEIVDLNASNIVLGGDGSADLLWRDVFAENLKKLGNYVVISREVLVGIYLLVFVKEELKDTIVGLDVDIVKTGLAGTLGNKGAVIFKFNLENTSICFMNCHMEAGEKANSARLINVTDFHQKAFQQGATKRPDDTLLKFDYTFFFGDMNFRLNIENEQIRTQLEKYNKFITEGNVQEAEHTFNWLLGEDQLAQSKDHHEYLSQYSEGKVTFLPTYKFDQNSDKYDTSKKNRPPAWTDRIMWHCTDGQAELLFYNKKDYKSSDHRPVVGFFRIKVKQVDPQAKALIAKELYQQGIAAKMNAATQQQQPQAS